MGGDCMSKMLLNRVVSVNTFQREFDLRCVELIQGTKNKYSMDTQRKYTVDVTCPILLTSG